MAEPLKIQVSPTSKMVEVNGAACRVWEGETEAGVEVFMFVATVGMAEDADPSEFESQLESVNPPSARVRLLPFSLNMN